MALSVQASSVSFSYQYTAMQSGAQPAGLSSAPAPANEGDNHAAFPAQFQSLAHNVEQAFKQLGIDVSEPRGGGVGSAATGSENAGPDPFKQALHDFMHALFHALKEAGAGTAGAPSGEGAALSASYTSVSFSLEVLSVRVDSAESEPPEADGSSAGGSAVSKLRHAYENLIDLLDSADRPEVSLKDFLKALQQQDDSTSVTLQQVSFSMEISVGSLVSTEA